MRAYGISVGILAAILVFSLWNSSYMTASTVRWREQLRKGGAPTPDIQGAAAAGGRPSPVRGLDRGRGYAGRQL